MKHAAARVLARESGKRGGFRDRSRRQARRDRGAPHPGYAAMIGSGSEISAPVTTAMRSGVVGVAGRKKPGSVITRTRNEKRPPSVGDPFSTALDQNVVPALNRKHCSLSVASFVSAWAKSARREPIGEAQRIDPPTDERIFGVDTGPPPFGPSTPIRYPRRRKRRHGDQNRAIRPASGTALPPSPPHSSCRRLRPRRDIDRTKAIGGKTRIVSPPWKKLSAIGTFSPGQ